jgi:DNA replication protein DnaC
MSTTETLPDGKLKIDLPSTGDERRNCSAHGEYTARTYGAAGVQMHGACPQCSELYRAVREKEEAQAREAAKPDLLKASAIPKRFADKSLADFVATSKEQKKAHAVASRFVDHFDDVRQRGTSVILCGTYGTGKTLLACAMAQAVIVRYGRSAAYTTALNAVRRIKDTWRQVDHVVETEKQAIAAFVKPDLLVLDEVGVQFGSEAEKLLLFDILNGRYEDVKPTIVISNLDVNGMAGYLGDRVMDRLKEGGGMIVPFEWQSHREGA